VLDGRKGRELPDAASPLTKSRVEAVYDLDIRPSLAPVASDLFPGVDGEMWLTLFDEDVAAPAKVIVLDRNARVIGQLVLPTGFALAQVGHDFVVGVETDSTGVPGVALYALTRKDTRRDSASVSH
jgi:hypothetical protein